MKGHGDIEFHEEGEWIAVYEDGRLVTVGDSYLADEWLQSKVGVKVVQDDAFMLGQKKSDGVAQTLDEVHAYAAERQEKRDRAAALRAEAQRLENEAARLVDPSR